MGPDFVPCGTVDEDGNTLVDFNPNSCDGSVFLAFLHAQLASKKCGVLDSEEWSNSADSGAEDGYGQAFAYAFDLDIDLCVGKTLFHTTTDYETYWIWQSDSPEEFSEQLTHELNDFIKANSEQILTEDLRRVLKRAFKSGFDKEMILKVVNVLLVEEVMGT